MHDPQTHIPNPEHGQDSTTVDVAIIGGGPAGLSAALWLGRFLYKVIVIDAGDPRNWQTRGIHGFLGHKSIQPAELRQLARQQCQEYDIHFIDDHVEFARHCPDNNSFQLTSRAHPDISARRLLITTGVRDNWPHIPGLERCYGTSIHTCPFCDGYEARNSRIAVLGTGSRAASVATTLRSWTRTVTICTNGQPAEIPRDQLENLSRLDVTILTAPILFLQARFRDLHHIVFEHGKEIPCDHIFIALGQKAANNPGQTLGCECDDSGRILVDATFQTSVPGVFAAGDITPGLQLAVRAASQGLDAAVAIHRSLRQPL